MPEKKIVVNISDTGEIDAETFNMEGTECLEELDKLLKDLDLETTKTKKEDLYRNSKQVDNTIKVKK